VSAADHVVIGGGIVGISVALELAATGAGVLVLEAATVAAGASGGPGMRGVRGNGRDPRELRLMARAYELWPAVGYDRLGQLTLFEDEADVATAEQLARDQSALGVPTEVIDAGRVRDLEPEVAELAIGAIHCPLDGIADQTTTTHALAEKARRAGVEIREGARVSAVRTDGGGSRARGVVVADEEVAVRRTVLIANNAGARDLAAGLGIDLPLFTVFPQIAITEPIGRPPVHHLVHHLTREIVLKPLPTGSVMLSGGRLGPKGEVDEDGLAAQVADATRLYPTLAGMRIDTATAHCAESVAHDFVPIVDRLPTAENVWLAAGWTGHGFAIAPAVAELLGGWLTTEDRPPLLEPFALSRFN